MKKVLSAGGTRRPSGMLDGDGLDDVSNIFALVIGIFQQVVDTLPAQDVGGVAGIAEHLANGLSVDMVGIVLDVLDGPSFGLDVGVVVGHVLQGDSGLDRVGYVLLEQPVKRILLWHQREPWQIQPSPRVLPQVYVLIRRLRWRD